MGHNTWNSLPDNLKSAINVNSLKHYIKEYFHKKLDNAEAGIYSYNQIDSKATFATVLEFMQNWISIVLPFSLFQYQDSFQCYQSFLCVFFLKVPQWK